MNIILLKCLDNHMINKTLDFLGEVTFNTLGIVSDQVSFVAIKEPQKEQELFRLEIESKDSWIPQKKPTNNSTKKTKPRTLKF